MGRAGAEKDLLFSSWDNNDSDIFHHEWNYMYKSPFLPGKELKKNHEKLGMIEIQIFLVTCQNDTIIKI